MTPKDHQRAEGECRQHLGRGRVAPDLERGVAVGAGGVGVQHAAKPLCKPARAVIACIDIADGGGPAEIGIGVMAHRQSGLLRVAFPLIGGVPEGPAQFMLGPVAGKPRPERADGAAIAPRVGHEDAKAPQMPMARKDRKDTPCMAHILVGPATDEARAIGCDERRDGVEIRGMRGAQRQAFGRQDGGVDQPGDHRKITPLIV